MPLRLLVGPANAGKVSRLLDRYVQALDREPCFVVPNRNEVERTERELLERTPGLLGGWIGTFDDLFELITRQREPIELVTPQQRRLVLCRVITAEQLTALGRSARFDGFVETLGDTIGELEAALLEPGDSGGELATLHRAYRAQLDALGLNDREGRQREAVELLRSERTAWADRPVFAYGFEDLTAAQWALIEALAARADVTLSLPYEPGRRAFESLRRTAEDLARLAGEALEELSPAEWGQAPALAYLERSLFEPRPADPPPIGGAVKFLEAAGTRAVLELVADEIATLLAGGVPADEVAVVCPDIERLRRPLELAFGSLGVPFAVDGGVRLGSVPFGRALLRLARFAWLEGTRADLFAFLRSRFSGVARTRVDFVEGRLRGRSITDPARVETEAIRLFEHDLEAVDLLREGDDPVEAVRELASTMMRLAWNPSRPQTGEELERDLAAHETVLRLLDDLADWRDRGGRVERDELVACLERGRLRPTRTGPGRVVVTDLLRARTRRLEAVFVLGLEEGALPRRAAEPPFLSEEERRELDAAVPARRLTRPDSLARDRYLFYSACTRARAVLALVRERATDDGRPLEASPFWDEVRLLFDPGQVERATRRRGLAELSWDLHRAPTERERLRALATLGADEPTVARSVAAANGWARRIERALAAFSRPAALTNPVARADLESATTFSVTDLELFGDCSSLWFVDRQLRPRDIDARVDPRLRGGVAHTALHRFYAGMPRRLGVDQVTEDQLEEAVEFLRECLAEAIESQVWLDLTEVQRLELEGNLGRDLEQFLRREVELGLPLVPRRLEVAFGNQRAAAELQRGLDLGGFFVSGKIDRIDLDPFSARGIVQDYKSGVAHSAARIDGDGRLQIPLYALALRDLVGIEPVGGLYRSLSGKREARGMLRADAKDELIPGLAARDYLDEDEFWGIVERAKERAQAAVERIRDGDVRHDPRAGECPSWCDRWSMCRVSRA